MAIEDLVQPLREAAQRAPWTRSNFHDEWVSEALAQREPMEIGFEIYSPGLPTVRKVINSIGTVEVVCRLSTVALAPKGAESRWGPDAVELLVENIEFHSVFAKLRSIGSATRHEAQRAPIEFAAARVQ